MIYLIFYFLSIMYNIISTMLSLPNDLLILISYYLNLTDIVALKQTNKECNTCFNDLFFQTYACSLYTKEFWKKAELRNPIISNPLRNMQQELLRIQNFNNILIKKGYGPWSEKEFILFWEGLEESFNNKIKKNYNCI